MRSFTWLLVSALSLSSPALAKGKIAPTTKKADEKPKKQDEPAKKATGETGPSQTPATADTTKKDVAPDQKPKTRFFEGMGRTAEEERQLEELSRAIELYENESREFRKEVQLLIEKKYE